jgi:predicted phage terminase large subunit-like protein
MSIVSGQPMDKCLKLYREVMEDRDTQCVRQLCQEDLFFLSTQACKRKDMIHPWIYDRCREVEAEPNGFLDLWAREHYKSTIITFFKTLQDILNDPEITIGIFSINRPSAKKFLSQIKTELTDNELLKALFPDVLYLNPEKESPSWSLDGGITVKRKGNPKEPTCSAHGLVEGMPTGAHFNIRVYDDIIDEDNVRNPEMIQKALRSWELSLNLGSTGRLKCYDEVNIERYVGTRYHFNDPYKSIMDRQAAKPRIYPGTIDGKVDGEPVLWSREIMEKKRRSMGSYTFGCQILQDPKADEAQGFKEEWLRFYTPANLDNLNLYLLCDPAGEKKKENDYTVMLVIGLGQDENYYLIDGLRDRLNLTERARKYIAFHRKYRPLRSGYEKYGKDSDIEHIKYVMEQENYRFEIVSLGGPMPKNDRIRKLIPLFEYGRFYLPNNCYFIDYEKKQKDLTVELLRDEYNSFPVAVHDDILDCMARIVDPALSAQFPERITDLQQVHDLTSKQTYDPFTYMTEAGL